MRPFDIKAALAGEKIVTRNGAGIKAFVYWPEATVVQQIVVLHHDGRISMHYADGTIHIGAKSDFDLFLADRAPHKHTRWINIYTDSNSGWPMACTMLYESEESAAKAALACYSKGQHVATLKVEWEEP